MALKKKITDDRKRLQAKDIEYIREHMCDKLFNIHSVLNQYKFPNYFLDELIENEKVKIVYGQYGGSAVDFNAYTAIHTQTLSEKYIESLISKTKSNKEKRPLISNIIQQNHNISEKFIRKYIKYVHWDSFWHRNLWRVSREFISEYKHKITAQSWMHVFYNSFNIEMFTLEFIDWLDSENIRMNWNTFWDSVRHGEDFDFPIEFLTKFEKEINWGVLAYHQKNIPVDFVINNWTDIKHSPYRRWGRTGSPANIKPKCIDFRRKEYRERSDIKLLAKMEGWL